MRTWLLGLTAIALAVSMVQPLYLWQQLFQNVPTCLALIALCAEAQKPRFSILSYVCVLAFVWLHILGARYIYSYVPYDIWSEALFGTSVSEAFGWHRNHYDRLVHFLFGLLAVPPLTEVGVSLARLSTPWAMGFAVCCVGALSAGYEVFEWLLAVFMSPANAEAYNGQQGDPWDAQKDMALAIGGSLLAICSLALFQHVSGLPEAPQDEARLSQQSEQCPTQAQQ